MNEREAQELRDENARLRQRVEALERQPAVESRPPASITARHVANDGILTDELYQAIKMRLLADAPGFIRVLQQQPELEIAIERKTVEVDGTSLKGRVARLMAEDFFTSSRTQGETRTALKRTGPDINTGHLSRLFGDLVSDGFLTREGDGYRMVPSMKSSIRKRSA